jgi:hypothetical protein
MRIVPRHRKETTMRKKPTCQNVEQLDLFVPPPRRPRWDQLPPAAKEKLTELLAELLRVQRKRNARPAHAGEAADE